MSFGKPNVPSASQQAAEAAAAEAERARKVRETSGAVNQVFDEKFGPSYYKGIGSAFKEYYAPQVADQFNDASRATKFRTANIAGSSAANRKFGDLYRDKLRADTDVDFGASDAMNRARQDVEAKRSNLIGMAEAGAGMENTAALARNTAASDIGRPTFSPIGDLFSKYNNALGVAARASDGGAQINPMWQKQIDFMRGGSKGGSQRIVGG